jgi:uncharacterized membrane protein YfcA
MTEFSAQMCFESKCTHKNLIPITWGDILCTLLVMIGSALCAGSGIGGGGIFVPVLMLVSSFTAKESVPLSKVMIFGGAIANYALNASNRHPTADRPLIDYGVCMILEPLTLLGTIIGVWVNGIFPPWLVLAFIFLFLFYTVVTMTRNAVAMYKKETRMSLEAITQYDENGGIVQNESFSVDMAYMWGFRERLLQGRGLFGHYSKSDSPTAQPPDENTGDFILQPIDQVFNNIDTYSMYLRERHANKKYVWLQVVSWAVFIGLALIKGGHGDEVSLVGVAKCSFMYWFVSFVMAAWLISMTLVAGSLLVKDHMRKKERGYVFIEGEVEWDRRSVIVYPLWCILAGVFAGMIGIGGGMVKVPLMIKMGMIPQVATASAQFMILFTSSGTVFQFFLEGIIKVDYAAWYFFLGLFSTFIGQLVITRIVKKLNRPSYIIFLVAFVVFTSCLFLISVSVPTVARDFSSSTRLGFTSMCPA